MRKNKAMIAVVTALVIVLTGCGTNNKIAKNQKEDVVKNNEKAAEQNIKETKEEISCASEIGAIGTVTSENPAINEETSGNVTDSNISSTVGNASAGNNNHNNNSSTSSGNQSNSSNVTHTGGSENASGNSTNSSSNNNTPAQTEQPTQPVHTHTWVHVDATGHYETVTLQAAYDEQVPVYENVAHAICNQCGTDITRNPWGHLEANIETCWAYHTEWRYEQTGTQTIHHDAVTEQRYIQDSPEYHVCSGCGVTTDCNCTR